MDRQESFPAVWRYLQTHLHAGDAIPNWTAHKGYLGDTITIAALNEEAITFDAPGAINLQVVPVEDFEIVWQNWPAYKRGQVKRSEIRDLTRYSKYIISALHWCEG